VIADNAAGTCCRGEVDVVLVGTDRTTQPATSLTRSTLLALGPESGTPFYAAVPSSASTGSARLAAIDRGAERREAHDDGTGRGGPNGSFAGPAARPSSIRPST
jgi:methylthioribose-1-phosphate isomerase